MGAFAHHAPRPLLLVLLCAAVAAAAAQEQPELAGRQSVGQQTRGSARQLLQG
jgi:hypothetical protein